MRKMNGWSNEFIPTGILDNILQRPSDHTEKEGCAANLEPENHEDDFQTAVADAGLEDSHGLSGGVYIDINETRKHPTSWLILAL